MEFAQREAPDRAMQEAWTRALTELQRRVLHDSPAGIWLPSLTPLEVRDDRFVVRAPNAYQARYLELNLGEMLGECVSHALQRNVRVSFVVPDSAEGVPQIVAPPVQPVRPVPPRAGSEFTTTPLNPRYTFAHFVVGASNRIAHAAAQSVVAHPGEAYNPLFLYGGVGLGKTHLMQAIGHAVRQHNPSAEVVYISGEVFLQHVVQAIREGKTDLFRERYRRVDVWLVDDIQFIASKEQTRTEAEFFFTFNALYESGRQIVISSDRPPKELQLMDDRLRSRFEMGLMTDIGTPDKETRVAILMEQAARSGHHVPPDVLDYIADLVQSNIRALEGAFRRVLYTASVDKRVVDIDLARECLVDFSIGDGPREASVAAVQQMVAERFGISTRELTGKSRTKGIVMPRQVAIYLCRKLTSRPLQAIGAEFGGRDHSTVLHACGKIEKAIADDPSLARVVEEITERIQRGATR